MDILEAIVGQVDSDAVLVDQGKVVILLASLPGDVAKLQRGQGEDREG